MFEKWKMKIEENTRREMEERMSWNDENRRQWETIYRLEKDVADMRFQVDRLETRITRLCDQLTKRAVDGPCHPHEDVEWRKWQEFATTTGDFPQAPQPTCTCKGE